MPTSVDRSGSSSYGAAGSTIVSTSTAMCGAAAGARDGRLEGRDRVDDGVLRRRRGGAAALGTAPSSARRRRGIRDRLREGRETRARRTASRSRCRSGGARRIASRSRDTGRSSRIVTSSFDKRAMSRLLVQRLARPLLRDLAGVGENVLDRAERVDELLRGLFADAFDAGNVVGRIADEREVVGHQRRRHAEPLARRSRRRPSAPRRSPVRRARD